MRKMFEVFTVASAIVMVLVIVLVLSSGCAAQPAAPEAEPEAELDVINMTLEWAPNAVHVPIIAGLEEGIYEEEGIDLQLHYPSGVVDSMRLTAVGESDVGVNVSGLLVSSVGAEHFPLVGLSEWQPLIPFGVNVLDPDLEVADFEGETFGIWDFASSRICFEKLLATAGLTFDDVEMVDPGFNVVPPLMAGQVLGVSSSPLYEGADCARQLGEPCPFFFYEDYGCGSEGMVLVANRNWLENNRELAGRFMRAFHRGLKFALENEDKAMEYWLARYPEFDPERERDQWRVVQTTFVKDYTKEHGLGWWDAERFQWWVDAFYEAGYIPEKFEPGNHYTNEFISEDLVPDNIDSLLAAQHEIFGTQ